MFRRTGRPWALSCLAAVLVLGVSLAPSSPLGAATKKESKADRLWVHPDFASFPLGRIAFLPSVSYDNNLQTEKLVDGLFAMSIRDHGYRWLSPPTAREFLRSHGGDSLLSSYRPGVLGAGRVDSLQAASLCTLLRCHSLLTVRIDLWEQKQPEWEQAGKPSTTVQLRAALVDSAGRLLWSAAGSNTMEGPYQEAAKSPVAISTSGLDTKPANAPPPPSYQETVAPVFARWAEHLPRKPSVAQPR